MTGSDQDMAEHYFTEKPKGFFRPEEFDIDVSVNKYHIHSGSGIFSRDSIDFGTRLLCENCQIPNSAASALDLGCGYGIVGIHIKAIHRDMDVTMVDINERSVRCAKQNVLENIRDAKGIQVFKSDIFSNPKISSKKFDIILSNPPFSSGKRVCLDFISESFIHLNNAGLLEIVAPHNKGGESLKKYMLRIFGNVGEIAKKRGYRVYISIKK